MNHYPGRSKNMKKRAVVLGQVYAVKVSGRVQPVRLIAESQYGGWVGRNEQTGREIRVRTAGKLRARLEQNGERWRLASNSAAAPIDQQRQQELTDQGVPY
jgi:hypothetical protein